MTEFDPTFDRIWRREEHKAEQFGPGGTAQGQALARSYRAQLAAKIAHSRANGGSRTVLRALRNFDDDTLVLSLLWAGISVSEPNGLGVDRSGDKNYREQAIWIGRNLGRRGETGFKVGCSSVPSETMH
jgi:hypothetical protein